MFLLLGLLACVKKNPEVAKPDQVEELESGAMRLGTVVFEGVEIDEKLQEDSLKKVEKESKDKVLGRIAEIEELLKVYQDFIQYEYVSDDDEGNADYLVEEKMEVFHQLTGSAYDIVMAERNYYEVSAAIYVAGASELRYAEMWNRYPTPEYLDHNSKIFFGERVRDTVLHLGDEGKEKLERIIAHYFRSMVSGEYTLAALEELQWRFPEEYPKPVSDKEGSALSVYYQYDEFQKDDAVDLPVKWTGTDQEQMDWMFRLEDAEMLIEDIQAQCSSISDKYLFLGARTATLCQLEELTDAELLAYRYPIPSWTPKMKRTQKMLEKEINEQVLDLENWSDSDYDLFWKKEVQTLVRQYQFEKMKEMRKNSREGTLISVDWTTWQLQEPEEMDLPTANILDSHLNQLERDARIMNYDINELDWDDRGMALRTMYVDFPAQLQELEFSIQAVLFAFPSNTEVHSRLMVSLIESYSYYVYLLPKLETKDSKKHIKAVIAMNKPFVLGLAEIVGAQDLKEPLRTQLTESIERVNGDVLEDEAAEAVE